MDEIDVNRSYFVHYVSGVAGPGARVLDYGCGDGTTVRLLRAAGFDAYGVDIRWRGADYGDIEATDLGVEKRLRYYDVAELLPFEDHMFDVVISDQVFEHVVPMAAALRELARVMRPGAVMYHHFPSRRVLREGHIGIPLTHRLPDGRFRLYYTALLRRIGFGTHKDGRPPVEWAAEKLAWVDDWTVYRTTREIHSLFGAYGSVRHREIDYCRFRAGNRRWLVELLDRKMLQRPAAEVFRLLAFDAFEVRLNRPAGGPGR
ncbi:MAG: class I SAM-dependent methyltransferase [Actinomycetota bacterium]